MKKNIDLLISLIKEDAQNSNFIHHSWYIKYHLEIQKKIVDELADIYTDADREVLNLLVWLHDYEKITRWKNKEVDDFEAGMNRVEELMRRCNYEESFVKEVIQKIRIIDRKTDIKLQDADIEVKIISSADAAAHLIGPFYQIYFYENASNSIDELMNSNLTKMEKDWNVKIVLPEIKEFFKARHQLAQEMNGVFPGKFLSYN